MKEKAEGNTSQCVVIRKDGPAFSVPPAWECDTHQGAGPSPSSPRESQNPPDYSATEFLHVLMTLSQCPA